MLIPITAEHHEPRRPIANIAIVVLTCLAAMAFRGAVDRAYLSAAAPLAGGERVALEGVAQHLVLNRGDARVTQLLGHAFMHADGWHLLANMVLLLALGNAVNARIGHARYVALYALSAAVGGFGWLLFGSKVLLVGASGAVLGVAAAFLVLFPITRVRVMFWALGLVLAGVTMGAYALGADLLVLLGGVGTTFAVFTAMGLWTLAEESPPEGAVLRVLGFRTFPLAGLWVVLFYVALDVVAIARGTVDGVAHEAHLAGALAGALVASGLLAAGVARGTPHAPTLFDLLGWTRPLERPAPPPGAAPPPRPTRRHRPELTFSDYARLRRT